MNIGSVFTYILVNPIVNLLVAIYHVFLAMHLPYALGFSIIALTLAIRFLLYPFTHSQLKSSKKMQDIAPHLSKLKEKHKSDSKMLQSETMKLYKEHGINPVAGCLPVLIQLPLIWALYGVLQHVVNQSPQAVMTYINKIVYTDSLKLTHVWDTSFFGIPLGKHPSDLIAGMPLIMLVPLLTGVLQFIQAKMMAPAVAAPKTASSNSQDDFAAAFQTQSVFVFPIMIAFFSYSFPIGLSLYWNTFTIFGILQQYQISGLGGLTSWKEKYLK